jgi:hypothetical protein
MATHEIVKYHIPAFWDDEFLHLDYVNEQFNDLESTTRWLAQGYANKFTGDMCDMRGIQPTWNPVVIDIFEQMGWQDVGTSYYRMMPGTILPTHQDLYKKYIDIFGLHGQEHTIRRAVVFLQDWQPGHYLEGMNEPVVKWRAGDVVEWCYDTPHMAANMGSAARYTLQVTGHVAK